MGKGTNYVKKPTTLDALTLAGRLNAHTVKIIKNENVFKPERDYQGRLLIKIYDLTLDILSKTFEANEIRVEDNPIAAQERLALQIFAIASCSVLLGLQGTAKIQFGIRERKFWYWVKMTKTLKTRLQSWHEGDAKRYGALAASAAKKDDLPKPPGGEGQNGCRLNLTLGGQLPLAFR